MHISHSTVIFRMFDVDKAFAFYLDFLGFEKQWEHRFYDGAPLYCCIKRGDCEIHLSEHHGDATPGSAIRIAVAGIHDYHKEISNKDYKYYNPAVEEMPWGTLDMSIQDPFGNRLIFFEDPRQKT